jgi:hypothetical protein
MAVKDGSVERLPMPAPQGAKCQGNTPTDFCIPEGGERPRKESRDQREQGQEHDDLWDDRQPAQNIYKTEETTPSEFSRHRDLRANLQVFFERYYNVERLHSALGYRSPDAFEHHAAKDQRELPTTPTMSF